MNNICGGRVRTPGRHGMECVTGIKYDIIHLACAFFWRSEYF